MSHTASGACHNSARLSLPRNLAAGEYLFTVEITAGGKTSERALRFRVR